MKKEKFSFKMRLFGAIMFSFVILFGGVFMIYTAETSISRNLSWVILVLLIVAVVWYIRTIFVNERLSKEIEKLEKEIDGARRKMTQFV
jgi:Flp pilus assembly protein TadB